MLKKSIGSGLSKIKGQIKMADESDLDSMSDDFMQLFADSGDEDEFEGWETGDILQDVHFFLEIVKDNSGSFSLKSHVPKEQNKFHSVSLLRANSKCFRPMPELAM
jgi:hypothetical protein